jgi:snRNA-activating protein complex subunit 1
MDLAPFRLDIDELLAEYAKVSFSLEVSVCQHHRCISSFDEYHSCVPGWQENYMSLSDFKRMWMAKKFSYIYEGRPKTNSGVFMQSLFLRCIGRLWIPG